MLTTSGTGLLLSARFLLPRAIVRRRGGMERGQGSGRYAVSWDHHRIVDAGGRYPLRGALGDGKRRRYATIFSFDRPRSRSTSTERRGRSRAGAPPRILSPWPPSCQPLVFTRATSVFTPAAAFTSVQCCI